MDDVPDGPWFCTACQLRRQWIFKVKESSTRSYRNTPGRPAAAGVELGGENEMSGTAGVLFDSGNSGDSTSDAVEVGVPFSPALPLWSQPPPPPRQVAPAQQQATPATGGGLNNGIGTDVLNDLSNTAFPPLLSTNGGGNGGQEEAPSTSPASLGTANTRAGRGGQGRGRGSGSSSTAGLSPPSPTPRTGRGAADRV